MTDEELIAILRKENGRWRTRYALNLAADRLVAYAKDHEAMEALENLGVRTDVTIRYLWGGDDRLWCIEGISGDTLQDAILEAAS